MLTTLPPERRPGTVRQAGRVKGFAAYAPVGALHGAPELPHPLARTVGTMPRNESYAAWRYRLWRLVAISASSAVTIPAL